MGHGQDCIIRLHLFQEIFRIMYDSYLCSFFEKEDTHRRLVNILIPTFNRNSEIGLRLQTQEMTLAHLGSNRTTLPSV